MVETLFNGEFDVLVVVVELVKKFIWFGFRSFGKTVIYIPIIELGL